MKKLTEPRKKMLLEFADSKSLGKFRHIKISVLNQFFGVWKEGGGYYKGKSCNLIIDLIELGYLVKKSTVGMWGRYVLSDEAKKIISESTN